MVKLNSDQPSLNCIFLHEILNLKKNMVITGVLFTHQKKCPRLFFTKTMTILGCKSPSFGLNVKWQPLTPFLGDNSPNPSDLDFVEKVNLKTLPSHSANGSRDKSLNFNFPIKYGIPESLKFSH